MAEPEVGEDEAGKRQKFKLRPRSALHSSPLVHRNPQQQVSFTSKPGIPSPTAPVSPLIPNVDQQAPLSIKFPVSNLGHRPSPSIAVSPPPSLEDMNSALFEDLQEEEEEEDDDDDDFPHDMKFPSLFPSSSSSSLKVRKSLDEDDEDFIPPPPTFDDFDITQDINDFDFAALTKPAVKPPAPPARRSRSLMQKKQFELCFYLSPHTRDKAHHWPVLVFDTKETRQVLLKLLLEQEAEDALLDFCVKLISQTSETGYVLLILGQDLPSLVHSRELFGRLQKVYSLLSKEVRKQCKRVLVLHPSLALSAVLYSFKRMWSSKFWGKLSFCQSPVELDKFLSHASALFEKNSFSSSNSDSERLLKPPSTFYHYWHVCLSFGVSLSVLCVKSPFGLPSFLMHTVTFLLYHGMKTPGLFRIGENHSVVQHCKQRLEAGEDIDLGGYWSHDHSSVVTHDAVHVCVSLLKSFFRELPEPLIPLKAYTELIQFSRTHGETSPEEFARLLASLLPTLLPQDNFHTLAFLCYFLLYCSKREQDTLMNAENLAKIWNINLFRHESAKEELFNLPQTIRLTLLFITQALIVFPVNPLSLLPRCFDPAVGTMLDEIVWDGQEREVDITNPPYPHHRQDSSLFKVNEFIESVQTEDDLDKLKSSSLKRYLLSCGVSYVPLEKRECVALAKECFRLKQHPLLREVDSKRTSPPTEPPPTHFLTSSVSSSTNTGEAESEEFLSSINGHDLSKDVGRWGDKFLGLSVSREGGGDNNDSRDCEEANYRALEEFPLFGEKTNRAHVLRPTTSTWRLRDLDTYSMEELKALILHHHNLQAHQASQSHVEFHENDLRTQARQALIDYLLEGGNVNLLG